MSTSRTGTTETCLRACLLNRGGFCPVRKIMFEYALGGSGFLRVGRGMARGGIWHIFLMRGAMEFQKMCQIFRVFFSSAFAGAI